MQYGVEVCKLQWRKNKVGPLYGGGDTEVPWIFSGRYSASGFVSVGGGDNVGVSGSNTMSSVYVKGILLHVWCQ